VQIVELTIKHGSSVLRNVPFKRGLNLILDAPAPSKTKSGNDVGKTTVLRLIDFCFGSSGDDIWQDAEFKNKINQVVFDFLHGTVPVTASLIVEDSIRGRHELSRSFSLDKKAKSFAVDGVQCKNLTEYKNKIKLLLFGSEAPKPSLRELMPKFIRSSQALMSKTLKFGTAFDSEAKYESLHLFLFGFFDLHILEERPRLVEEKKRLERDLEALQRLRKEGEIEQLLIHSRREIENLSVFLTLRGEVPEIASRAAVITRVRAKATETASLLSQVESETAALRSALEALAAEYDAIDDYQIEAIYREAQQFIPELHHEWVEVSEFVQNLRGRKQRYLSSQIEVLESKALELRRLLESFSVQEREEIGDFTKSPEFRKSLELRSDLQEKLKKLGSLEQTLADIRSLKSQNAEADRRLEQTRLAIEAGKGLLQERIAIFNKHFSSLSKLLYGDEYLLHVEETSRGNQVFELTAIGSNVGTGKKVSQTAAFDLAYIEFLRETKINFPTFVCHDGVESVHANQLTELLSVANGIEGQLILATLRDKLPEMPDGFISENTVLELSEVDKFFKF
jgi:uncharacterized protein YydD (DUF2326 family)